MAVGTPEPKISAKAESLISFTVNDTKDGAAEKIINFPAQFQGLASSVLIDNQDGANACTVKINRNFKTITIAASSFRAFNDSWISQLNITGASTDTQVTAQVTPLTELGLGV